MLYVYTRSIPCGSTTVNNFTTISKKRYWDDLEPDKWSMEGENGDRTFLEAGALHAAIEEGHNVCVL